jgi:hypothetical protein
MLNYKQSSFFKSREHGVLAGSVIAEEGRALVYTREGAMGATEVKLSTGVEGEVFAGFSLSTNTPAIYAPKVEELTLAAPATGESYVTISLERIPTSVDAILAKIDGTALPVEAGTAGAAGKAILTPEANLIVPSTESAPAQQAFIQYTYELTASEASAITGDYFGGSHNTASRVYSRSGVVLEGVISTSCYDTGADWAGVINPTLGADGFLTVGGDGTLLTNVIVQDTPNSENAFLTVEVK